MENNNEYYYPKKQGGNGTLTVVISVLAAFLIAAIVIVSLMLTRVIKLPGTDVSRTMYVINNAYVREEPNDTSIILISLSPGAAVTYHKDANDIYASITFTNSDGVYEGYVEKALLSVTQPKSLEVATMYVANVKHSIYFRSAPVEQDSNIITEILLATPVSFIENTDAVFAKVSYNGQEGYVKREYLSPTPPQIFSAQSGNTTISGYRYVSNVKDSIYLRSAPYENSGNIICTIPLGTQVGFIEYADSTFSKISYNGTIGYAKSEYLSYGSVKAYDTMTVCNVAHSIYLRSTPKEESGNIICEIPVGSTVSYIENANSTFYKISWNGYVGYSKKEYLR